MRDRAKGSHALTAAMAGPDSGLFHHSQASAMAALVAAKRRGHSAWASRPASASPAKSDSLPLS
ncbi:hypothetical protein [Chromobacterium subtsugae]|uniref:hypothetical protein n=1 Tax=Chromobacterium subtsugae TaxID=251747 RepID=UPI0012FF6BE5|nr:hypothetical protein [Chromobacterium subtsugae]